MTFVGPSWRVCRAATVLLTGVLAVVAAGDPETPLMDTVRNVDKARVDYMLNCQGCHLPEGRGIPGVVPVMKDYVGNFLRVRGGREFLVQVPGSANAALDDAALADLLNWVLVTMSPEQLPAGWVPYTGTEVSKLRAVPLREVTRRRAALVEQM